MGMVKAIFSLENGKACLAGLWYGIIIVGLWLGLDWLTGKPFGLSYADGVVAAALGYMTGKGVFG